MGEGFGVNQVRKNPLKQLYNRYQGYLESRERVEMSGVKVVALRQKMHRSGDKNQERSLFKRRSGQW